MASSLQIRAPNSCPRLAQPSRRPARAARTLCRASTAGSKPTDAAKQAAVAGLAASVLLLGSAPWDAADAATSAGRVSNTSGFAAKKQAAVSSSTTTVNSYSSTVVVTPQVVAAPIVTAPVVAAPVVVAPAPAFPFLLPVFSFSGLLQITFLMLVIGVVFGVVRAIASAASGNKSKASDAADWDTL